MRDLRLDLAPVLKNYLREMLMKSAITGEPIEVSREIHRGIGKTTALVEFAKEYDFIVVVTHSVQAKALKQYTGYENIIGQNEIGSQRIDSRFVYDEGVDVTTLKSLKVVTGFIKI